MCNSCGWIAKSKCCDTSLVLHQNVKRLKCHRCESVWGIPSICPECGSSDFSHKGIGTQQVEEVLSEKLPNSNIVRIDRDTVSRDSVSINSDYIRIWQFLRKHFFNLLSSNSFMWKIRRTTFRANAGYSPNTLTSVTLQSFYVLMQNKRGIATFTFSDPSARITHENWSITSSI